MKKILYSVIICFLCISNVSAEAIENLKNLKIETTFSSNVDLNDFTFYKISIQDGDDSDSLVFNISDDENYNYSFENFILNSADVIDIAILDNNGKYGYTYKAEGNNQLSIVHIYIYNISKDKNVLDGKTISNSIHKKNDIIKTDNIKTSSDNNLFKIFVMVSIVVIVFLIIKFFIKIKSINTI